jgi:hypothetical protein
LATAGTTDSAVVGSRRCAVQRDAQHELRQVGAAAATVALVNEIALGLAREQIAVQEEENARELVPDRRQSWHRPLVH